MAGKSRKIKDRMKAVGNIKRITKTMQLIATARFQTMQRRATDARAYTRHIGEVVRELAASVGDEVSNPLLTAPRRKAGRELLLVLTSNRGLCGAYNANVLRTATAHLRKADTPVELEVVGKKGVGFFKFSGQPVSQTHDQIGDTPAYEDVVALADRYIEAFTAGQYDAIHVAYMAFKSSSKQTATLTQLLPMQPPKAAADANKKAAIKVVYEFSPNPEQLLNELLPVTIKTRLYQCFNEAVVSEQVSRMVAMKSATDASEKMGKTLQRKFNRARQTAITTELSEIISGAAALE